MKNIVVTGSLAYDYIMDFPDSFENHILPEKLKTLSVSFLVQNFSKNFGGTAGNIAYSLCLLGRIPKILSSCGERDFALYKHHLTKQGVDIRTVREIQNEFTSNAFIVTDKNNCQIAGFYPGAMIHDEVLSVDKKADFLIISPTIPAAMDKFAQEAAKLKIPYLYDPAQSLPLILTDQLIFGVAHADIIIGNDYELSLIEKKTGLSKKEMLRKVPVIVTTLGEKGSVIETQHEYITVGTAKPKKIVDPTGAGDAYIAGFICGYLAKKDIKTCGQMGATLASFAIEQYGTQNHKLSQEDFKKRYTQTFSEMVEFDQ